MVTADTECRIAFWSLRPLATFDDFHEEVILHSSDATSSMGLGAQSFGITCMVLSSNETELFVATDSGALVCIGIHEVVTKAQALAEEAKRSLAGGSSDSPGQRSR